MIHSIASVEAGDVLCPLMMAVPDYGYCIGPKCAAWRWYDRPAKTVVDATAAETGGEAVTHQEPTGKNRRGYCGIGGDIRYRAE